MAAPCVKVFDSDSTVAEELCSFIIEKANKAIHERGTFFVGVSGKWISCSKLSNQDRTVFLDLCICPGLAECSNSTNDRTRCF